MELINCIFFHKYKIVIFVFLNPRNHPIGFGDQIRKWAPRRTLQYLGKLPVSNAKYLYSRIFNGENSGTEHPPVHQYFPHPNQQL